MRIGVFVKGTTYHQNSGGLEEQNRILCEGLAKRGHDIFVYTPCYEILSYDFMDKGVNYRFIDSKYKNSSLKESILNRRVKEEWYEKSLERFTRDHSEKAFDLVISQSSAGLGAIRNKKRMGFKILAISHGTIWAEFRTKMAIGVSFANIIFLAKDFEYAIRNRFTVQKEFLLSSDAVVAVSNFVKENVIKEAGVTPAKVEVIYNGVADLKPDVSKRNQVPLTVLYVGRIEKEKGLKELVDLFSELLVTHPDCELILVGGGPFYNELNEYVSKKGVSYKVKMAGKVAHEKLREFYETSSVFVLPTKRLEGFPVTVSEALMSSLPIVATKSGGLVEGVTDSKNGYLVEMGDFRSFKRKLDYLIKEKNVRDSFAQFSRRLWEEKFLEEKMLESYENLIKKLVGGRA